VSKRATLADHAAHGFSAGQYALYKDCLSPIAAGLLPDPAAAFDPRPFLAKLPIGKSVRTYRRGEVVFFQGAIADAVHWIDRGEVQLTVVSEDGKEAVTGIVAAGSFFGESCLAGEPLWMASATAVHATTLLRIPREAMVNLLHREPAFAEGFIAYLLSRHIRMEQDLLDQLFNSSEKRLARLLLLLANYGKQPEPLPPIENISHEILAEMIGTTRSRVTFFMNRFRKLGFIDYNGGTHVHGSLQTVLHNHFETRR